jgi:Kef-type K+ transport system membrane component KefB
MPTNHELAIRLFLQLAVILAASKITGILLRYLGQTQVVSEMIAGVLLGPSFFGLIAPNVQKFLFPTSLTLALDPVTKTITHPSMTILFALSQVGLVLYMFLIGLQFNIDILSKHFKQAGLLSVSGILAPMFLGGALGLALSYDNRLFTTKVEPWQAGIFMASAMLITAFPMLARIIYESGIANTKIGTLALSAAAFDDAVAWSMLAIVLATIKKSPMIAILAIGGGILYAVTMIFFGRPLFQLFSHTTARDKGVGMGTLTTLLFVLITCAWVTDAIGIYSIFGAFIVGAAMPRGQFTHDISRLIEYLNVALLLPIFFVYSGLNTQIGLLVQPSLLWITFVVILTAFVCKGGACFLATRMGGSNWREAGLVGVLMNARGLMELILINIGLDNGLISPALFTILVMMAILTTVVASPIFKLLYRNRALDLPT